MKTYEDILAEIAAIPDGLGDRDRDIYWLTPGQVVGVARDPSGRLELFLAGAELQPRTATVRNAVEFHSWHRANGEPLRATRLLLPAYGHYDQVGSFICTELLREGADQDIERAFLNSEPIIELAIQRLQLSQSALVGLAGELLLVERLCRLADSHLVAQVVESWDGWRRSARDLTWQGTGLEIKTTLHSTSTHSVGGIHQVELADDSDGRQSEEQLLLVSVGLQHSPPDSNSFSIPALVQRIVERLTSTGHESAVGKFLRRVSAYGTESGFGYDHQSMSEDVPFTMAFTAAFVRGYDMSDPDVEVLRRGDISKRHHVEISSVTFQINLPAIINPQNPINGAGAIAEFVLRV